MCRVLGVSSAGFYAAQERAPSARAQRDEELRPQIHAAFRRGRWRYGAPRIHADLQDADERVGRKRVARLMRMDGLVARPARRWGQTRDSAHAEPIAPNRLARQFAVDQVAGPDQVWVSDLTDVPTRAAWLFLAVNLDLATRRPRAGLVHHSDRGSQYASTDYQAVLPRMRSSPA